MNCHVGAPSFPILERMGYREAIALSRCPVKGSVPELSFSNKLAVEEKPQSSPSEAHAEVLCE
jgi:hypothetical protein